MKILLFGKSGQVGWELQRSLAPLGELIAIDRHSRNFCGDLVDLKSLANTVQMVRPDVIVNAAAYTGVDRAESEPELARVINATAPGVLAVEAQKLDAWLVHYSTDYVFDGSGTRPWMETDTPAPLNVYGQTKLEGEQRITEYCKKHLIFRTCWVYSSRGDNFVKTVLRLAQESERLYVIDDQFGAPTGAELLADVTAHAVCQVMGAARQRAEDAGIYHLAASGETTWHRYANHVICQVKKVAEAREIVAKEVAPVSTSAFFMPARRPHNSRLSTARLQATFALTLPPWELGVNRMLAETSGGRSEIMIAPNRIVVAGNSTCNAERVRQYKE